MFIDTHAHLFFPNFENDLEKVIKRAKGGGVDFIIVPGTDITTSLKAVELAEKYDFIYAAVGVRKIGMKIILLNWKKLQSIIKL